MLSGIGPKDHLDRFGIPVLMDLPVGNNYKNHPTISQGNPTHQNLSIINLEELYRSHTGVLSKVPYLVTYFSTRSNPNADWPDIWLSTFLGPNNKVINGLALSRVKSRGTVRLQSTSPYVQPLIDPNIFGNPDDYPPFFEATKLMFLLSQKLSVVSDMLVPALNSTVCPSCPGKRDYECDEGIACYIRLYASIRKHSSGTCRMGAPDRDDVVVDPQLRVKNMKRLRVCDASIFPDIPNGNTYAPALMVGEKCAQIIKDCYNL